MGALEAAYQLPTDDDYDDDIHDELDELDEQHKFNDDSTLRGFNES